MGKAKNGYSDLEKRDIFNNEFMVHIDALYNFAFKLTLDEDEAKDLLQDTCMKAFRFIDSFEKGTNAKAWLFRILKNNFINDYRKKSKTPGMVDYQEVETYYNSEDGESPVEITTDLRSETIKGMLGDEITNALNSMDVDFRTVIILCDLEGFKYEEIAQTMNLPIGTVKSRIFLARKKLQSQLKDYRS